MSESFPYIRAIEVVHNRVTPGPFLIDLPPAEGKAFSHLILTGKNGSGKSSTLEALVWALLHRPQQPRPGGAAEALPDQTTIQELRAAESWRPPTGTPWGNVFASGLGLDDFTWTGWTKIPEGRGQRNLLGSRGAMALRQRLDQRSGYLVPLGARRDKHFQQADGPGSMDWNKIAGEHAPLASTLLKFLVSLRFLQSLASEDGDRKTADEIAQWFQTAQQEFSSLFDMPGLRLVFHRERMEYAFLDSEDRSMRFEHLPDGYATVLKDWSELAQRDMAVRRLHPEILHAPGLVIIDEIDAHLHLSLQEKILPFLTRLFPAVQFIVATHSPAVISSVDDAIVYDLSSHQAHPSAELQGIRYGTLISGHFGLGHDLDRDSADKMARLGVLARQSPRSEAEEAELRALSSELSARSSSLALEVWTELEYKKRLAAKGIQG